LIELRQTDRVAEISLNRPDKRNALNAELCHALVSAFEDADADPGIGAILLQGNGPAFCAGMDLREAVETDSSHLAKIHERLFTVIDRMNKPVVAAVRGAALAGGTGLAANAHIVVAAPDANFGITEIRIGLWPVLVFRACILAMGERRATELSLTGRVISAEQAREYGLVTEVAADPQIRALELAVMLSEQSPAAMSAGLGYVRNIRGLDWPAAGALGREVRAGMMSHPDFLGRARAFLDKRPQ
jgi:enoyl-CoA hydratase/carnithine racemase